MTVRECRENVSFCMTNRLINLFSIKSSPQKMCFFYFLRKLVFLHLPVNLHPLQKITSMKNSVPEPPSILSNIW